MSAYIESGHAKNTANFDHMIALLLTYNTNYTPSNANFFDVAKHNKIIFEASKIIKNEDVEARNYFYTAKGKLTIKGVTKDAQVKFNYFGVED